MGTTRIILGVAAAGMTAGALLTSTGTAQADDFNYLGGLRAAGVWIHKDAEPFTLKQAHRLCEKLRQGVPPDEVASEFPALPAPVFLQILRDNECPDAPG